MNKLSLSKEYLGKITLHDKAVVSDPCYDCRTWCSAELTVLPGTYNCYTITCDTGMFGKRIAQLIAVYADKEKDLHSSLLRSVRAQIGVDSGQCGIYDSEYFQKTRKDEVWYKEICSITYDDDKGFLGGTKDALCAVSASGYGDGGYMCMVQKDTHGDIFAIVVDFAVEDEEEEEEETW